MPQELQVLRCFACNTFQVHIVKKDPKWVCKMCNEKQSLKKVYGIGNGRDCRLLVQKLNMEQHERKENPTNETMHDYEQSMLYKNNYDEQQEDTNKLANSNVQSDNVNKWLEFVSDDEYNDEEDQHQAKNEININFYKFSSNLNKTDHENYSNNQEQNYNFSCKKRKNITSYNGDHSSLVNDHNLENKNGFNTSFNEEIENKKIEYESMDSGTKNIIAQIRTSCTKKQKYEPNKSINLEDFKTETNSESNANFNYMPKTTLPKTKFNYAKEQSMFEIKNNFKETPNTASSKWDEFIDDSEEEIL